MADPSDELYMSRQSDVQPQVPNIWARKMRRFIDHGSTLRILQAEWGVNIGTIIGLYMRII